MSLHVNMHRPTNCTSNSGAGFGCSISFSDKNGQEVTLYLPFDKAEAARCFAEYFNDNIAVAPEDDDPGF